MDLNYDTREGMEKLAGGIVAGAREVLDAGGSFNPLGLLLGRIDPESEMRLPEPIPFAVSPSGSIAGSAERGAAWAAAIRKAANELDALATIVAMEAWYWRDEEAKADKREAIFVMIEHEQLGDLGWIAEISREGFVKTVGEMRSMLNFARDTHPGAEEVRARGPLTAMMPKRWMS